MEVLEKGPTQQLMNKNRDAIRARDFIKFCLWEYRCNFTNSDIGRRNFPRRVNKRGNVE